MDNRHFSECEHQVASTNNDPKKIEALVWKSIKYLNSLELEAVDDGWGETQILILEELKAQSTLAKEYLNHLGEKQGHHRLKAIGDFYASINQNVFAQEWYVHAAQEGNFEALSQLDQQSREKIKIESLKKCYAHGAHEGDSDAAMKLGNIFLAEFLKHQDCSTWQNVKKWYSAALCLRQNPQLILNQINKIPPELLEQDQLIYLAQLAMQLEPAQLNLAIGYLQKAHYPNPEHVEEITLNNQHAEALLKKCTQLQKEHQASQITPEAHQKQKKLVAYCQQACHPLNTSSHSALKKLSPYLKPLSKVLLNDDLSTEEKFEAIKTHTARFNLISIGLFSISAEFRTLRKACVKLEPNLLLNLEAPKIKASQTPLKICPQRK